MVTSREAAKCLANVLLLEGKTRQIFVDLGYFIKAAQRLKVGLSYAGIVHAKLNNSRTTTGRMSYSTLAFCSC